MYDGLIEKGMGFIWEPKPPYAREALVVRETRWNERNAEMEIKSVSQAAIGSPETEARRAGSNCLKDDRTGTWNSEGRFREACVRCDILDELV